MFVVYSYEIGNIARDINTAKGIKRVLVQKVDTVEQAARLARTLREENKDSSMAYAVCDINEWNYINGR